MTLTLPVDEFRARCDAAIEAALERGLEALLVWGRGGGPVDGGADLLYLTDFYSAFPTIPDQEHQWAGRGFSAALLFPDGRVALVADVEGAANQAFATEAHTTDDLVADVAEL